MTEATVSAMPQVTLSNGLRVANFSSPHPFEFETGETVGACDADRARSTALIKREDEQPHPRLEGVIDVAVTFEMSDVCRAALEEAERLAEAGEVDVILIPFPVREAICRDRKIENLAGTPFRVILVPDRVTRKVSPDRFCT